MSAASDIEWTDATWPALAGCSNASPGCARCYAIRQAHRMGSNPNEKVARRYRHLTVVRGNGPQWTGEVRPLAENLALPLTWKRPRRIFVNSLSDTFHESVPDEYVAAMFGVMAAATQHTFQVLTKRAARMRAWFGKVGRGELETAYGVIAGDYPEVEECVTAAWSSDAFGELPDVPRVPWPLPNVHLGVSVEDRKHGVPRIAELRATPAARRFLSVEPLLEDLGELDLSGIDLVILGGESGPGARPCDLAWIRRVMAQCRAQGVKTFVKQLGARPCGEWGEWRPGKLPMQNPHPAFRGEWVLRDAKGGDMEEWPHDLRVREELEASR